MKKRLLSIFAIGFLAITMASCGGKCVTCSDCPEGVTLTNAAEEEVASLEVCEDDFDSKEEYDQAISLTEGFGCDCK